MLKKTITYTDFDGNEQTEDHYFNLTKAELAKMELSTEGGLVALLQRVSESNNGKDIIDTFEMILAKTYGIRSQDGRRFIKSDEISAEFAQSAAYDVFFTELLTDSGAAADFINAVVPQDIRQQAQDHLPKQGTPPSTFGQRMDDEAAPPTPAHGIPVQNYSPRPPHEG